MTYLMLGGATVLGLGIAALMVFRGKKPKKPLIKSQMSESFSFDFVEPAAAPKKAGISVGPPREKRTSSTATATKAPSAAPTATRTASAKPKPKPPPSSP